MPSECCNEYKTYTSLYQKSSAWCFTFSHTLIYHWVNSPWPWLPGAWSQLVENTVFPVPIDDSRRIRRAYNVVSTIQRQLMEKYGFPTASELQNDMISTAFDRPVQWLRYQRQGSASACLPRRHRRRLLYGLCSFWTVRCLWHFHLWSPLTLRSFWTRITRSFEIKLRHFHILPRTASVQFFQALYFPLLIP